MSSRVRPFSRRGASVQEDWRAWLPKDKAYLFQDYTCKLESAYSMFSVSLNEAIGLFRVGSRSKSVQILSVTPALSSLLIDSVSALLRALGQHAKHYGTTPNTAPLDPANFQSHRGQRSARMSGLLSRVLLTNRSQFLHKIGALQEMVEDAGKEFRSAAEELVDAVAIDPADLWETIDAAHYDMNTCLRETFVLLKCFLLAIPDDQLALFHASVDAQFLADAFSGPPRRYADHPRRMASTARE